MPDLHVVSFAVPYPPDYGGAIDVWNRLRALSAAGVKIELHCFIYSSFKPNRILHEVAEGVRYYPRVIWPSVFSKSQPYIVTSRKCPELYNALIGDDRPILFEGIHSTGFVPDLKNRKLILRAHNIEHQYYAELARESTGLRSLIFKRESQNLESYEKRMASVFDTVLTISPKDQEWYAAQGSHGTCLPPFHGIDQPDCTTGRGQFLLYQGDLSIEMNQNALLDLLGRLDIHQNYPVVVAGKSGDKTFESKLTQFANLRREADVSQEKMTELIHKSHIVLIHSLHKSGMKLKVFPALYHGKFVAASVSSMTNTELDQAMNFYTPETIVSVTNQLWQTDFTFEHQRDRRAILSRHPSDMDKAKEIIRYL